MSVADVVDKVIEAPVVTSFTRLGFTLRRRIDGWQPLWTYDLRGQTVVITGPTSGLGEAAAHWLARLGSTLCLVARNAPKVDALAARLTAETGNEHITTVVADLADRDAIRRAVGEIRQQYEQVDTLIHNAGALATERTLVGDGSELTVAVHVVGPFLMTGLLLDRFGPASRVITVSSGGMYTAPVRVTGLEMGAEEYRGAAQYALAKRAQVTLNEMWAARVREVRFHAMHPGWADTPGVEASLPGFRRLVGPLLRSPDQGADTMVWLAADQEALRSSGRFWLDRRPRPIHRLKSTARSDTPERRERLWQWVADRAGWERQ